MNHFGRCLLTPLCKHQLIERMHSAIWHVNGITFIYFVSRSPGFGSSAIQRYYIAAPILFLSPMYQIKLRLRLPPRHRSDIIYFAATEPNDVQLSKCSFCSSVVRIQNVNCVAGRSPACTAWIPFGIMQFAWQHRHRWYFSVS